MPRVHVVHDGVPFRRRLREADRGNARASRTPASAINAATVRVLAAEGCEVVAPPDQPCCGALMVHAGEEAPALALARRVIDVFEKVNVDVVITNAGGCGSNVREYGYQLRDDPQYAE